MSSYDSMKEKLAPLGLYSFEQGGAADSELKSYGAGLDIIQQAIDELEREGMILTAESYGLSERERFIDREKPQLSVAQRRALILEAEQKRYDKATKADFEMFLSDCGLVNFNIREVPLQPWFYIDINDTLTDGQKRLVRSKIAGAVPPNLNVIITYSDQTQETL